MSTTVRSALRVVFLTVIILSASAVGQSFVQATGQSAETGQLGVGAQGDTTEQSTDDTSDQPETDTPTSRDDETSQSPEATPTATPAPKSTGQSLIDVESRFQDAKAETQPGENWSAQRVRQASGQRGLTVVATQGFYPTDQTAELAALTPNGTLVYFNDSYKVYFDVDPVEDERYTVEYVASRYFDGSDCQEVTTDECTRNDINRVNLTTGEHETLYSELTPRVASTRWHDVDRLNETHLVVADIYEDSVFTIDTRDESIVQEWNFSEYYSDDAGGQDGDWTHLNDVEILDDGRLMLSPRNMDEVIFLNRTDNGGYAVDDSWTLGEDDDHSILFEQHNADYIPPAYGGPAVIVADSENTRIVEYQRVDGNWVQTWAWRDVRLQWPRDADRLPGGNTLVVDTNGNRLVELNAEDEIVWSVEMGMPYDVERIGTGDESQGGPAARYRAEAPIRLSTPAGAEGSSDETNGSSTRGERASAPPLVSGDSVEPSAVGGSTTAADRFWFTMKDLVPPHVSNGLLYASPPWVLFTDIAFTALFLLVGLCWAGSEFYWSRYTLRGIASNVGGRLRTGVDQIR